MKNFVYSGAVVGLPAPYDILSGQGFLVGTLFAVATMDGLATTIVEGRLEGVYDLPKADTQAWTVGQAIYWDATNRVCTNTSNSGANKLIGAATLPVANTAGLTVGRVRLNGNTVV